MKKIIFIYILIAFYTNYAISQITKVKHKQIHSFSYSNLITANLNGKWGIVDDSNNIYVPFEYDSIIYKGISHFIIFKNNKQGLVTQFDNSNKLVSNKVRMINALFDSIQLKQFFVKAFTGSLVSIYWYDGSLLFPTSPNSKVCSIKLTCENYRKCQNPYKVFEKTKKKFSKDSSYQAEYYHPIIFYNNKYYRLDPEVSPYFSEPTTVSEIKLSKYFKRQIRKDKNHCCID